MLKTKSQEPRSDALFFVGACLFYVFLYLIFYPPTYAYRDEGMYLIMAEALKQGKLFLENTGLPIQNLLIINGRWAPFYPPGNALLLAVLTSLGWHFAFLLGPTSLLCSAYFFRKLARDLGCSSSTPWLLYLFFPSFVYYSRTLMSDLPSLALFCAAYSFYFRPNPRTGIAGALFGLSLFFRVSNVLVCLPFALALGIQSLRDRSWFKFLRFIVSLAPFALAAGLYNTAVYGSPLLNGYSQIFSGVKNFSITYFPGHLKFYLLSLNIAYPGMLAAFLFFSKTRRNESLLLCLLLLVFFSFYYFRDSFPIPGADFIFSNRFLFPMVPFLIIGLASFIERLLSAFRPSPLLTPICVWSTFFFLSAFSIGIHVKHQNVLKSQKALSDLIYKNTNTGDRLIYDSASAELLQPAFGNRCYHLFSSTDTLRNQLNLPSFSSDSYFIARNLNQEGFNTPGYIAYSIDIELLNLSLVTSAEMPGLKLYKLKKRNF